MGDGTRMQLLKDFQEIIFQQSDIKKMNKFHDLQVHISALEQHFLLLLRSMFQIILRSGNYIYSFQSL